MRGISIDIYCDGVGDHSSKHLTFKGIGTGLDNTDKQPQQWTLKWAGLNLLLSDSFFASTITYRNGL